MTVAQAYQLGDLDGDIDNDEVDFELFKDLFDAANGAGSFDAMLASVPEPAPIVLVAWIGLAMIGWPSRKSSARP